MILFVRLCLSPEGSGFNFFPKRGVNDALILLQHPDFEQDVSTTWLEVFWSMVESTINSGVIPV